MRVTGEFNLNIQKDPNTDISTQSRKLVPGITLKAIFTTRGGKGELGLKLRVFSWSKI